MALSEDSIEKCIKPSMRRAFYENFSQWFCRRACEACHPHWVEAMLAGTPWNACPQCIAVSKADKREPGLFKTEFEGTGMCCISSKTYYCWGTDGSEKRAHKVDTLIKMS